MDSRRGLYRPEVSMTDPVALQSEITFLHTILDTLNPETPSYLQDRLYYQQQINSLALRLHDVFRAGQSLASSVGTPDSSTDWGMVARKRPRELSPSPGESLRNNASESPSSTTSLDNRRAPSNLSAGSASKRGRQSIPLRTSADFVDLAGDEHSQWQPFQPLRTGPQGFADPFPELAHAYQPRQVHQPVQAESHPADAFIPDAMDLDQLAQLMLTPTSPSDSYAHNLPVPALNPFTPLRPTNFAIRDARLGLNPASSPMLSPMFLPSSSTDPDVVASIIENIKSQDDDGTPREQTPKAMCSTLMEHQKRALAWLLNMEKGKNKGSILADEMGLGKTIEALSLILANPSSNPARKTTLIVAPVALIQQWEKEIERHVRPSHRLSVYIYHRNGNKADFNKLRQYDVVLTTFQTLAQELRRIEKRDEARAIERERQNPDFKRKPQHKLALLGPECYWYRVILDEAQNIKSRVAQSSKAAAAIQAEYRLCMTGTPMQNSVEELYPLVRFLRITMYQTWPAFNDAFVKPLKASKGGYAHDQGMRRLQALIKSIMLRREKTTMIDGKPICDLPPKRIQIQSVEFSDAERELYKAVEEKTQLKFNRYLQKGTVNNNYANILVMLLRLRQICCHPHLVSDLAVQVSTDGISEDDLLSRAEKLDRDVVRRLKDSEGFECPICFETEINPTIIIPCGHSTCGECFQKLIDPGRATRDGDEGGAKCPECRGRLSSDWITDYRHFCKVFCPDKYEELRRALLETGVGQEEEEEDKGDYSDSDEESESDDEDDEDATLGGFIVPDDVDDDNDAEMVEQYGFVSDDPDSTAVPARKLKAKGKGKGKGKEKAIEDKLSLAQLKKMSLRNRDAKQRYLKRLKKTFKSSAKIDMTIELLTRIQENDPTEKTLIFSSFTTLLDLIEVPLSKKKFRYQRYDGSMKFEDRVDAVNEFMDSATENIMLVSMKAGNAGLNLNKASQVIMLDPFWNPFVEDQAVDRAHRMPQKREVHVHRLLVPETVEDRICKLQDRKREIINAALDERAGQSLTKLSVNELRSLFGL